jgi:putative aldouronate transport system permease protein
MLLPALVLVIIFAYVPMYGVVIAFQDFNPGFGLFGPQTWVGIENFKALFDMPNFGQVLWNTVYLAGMKMLFGLLAAVGISILLNEVRGTLFKRCVQTVIYLPNFLSWVILSGIFISVFSPSEDGVVNHFIMMLGGEKIFFLGDNNWFPQILIITDVWKNFGFGTIVYLATITSIDPQLYEAAAIDGAGRWQKIWHITLPGMKMIIVLMTILNLGNILNAGFDQVFNMYSALVMESGDILDTFVYRLGIGEAQYSVATAAGLFKSGVSLLLISASYFLAYKFAKYKIF